MTKDTYLELGKNIAGFEIKELDRAPGGLTAKILWDP